MSFRWIKGEIERRLLDEDDGKIECLKDMFNNEFRQHIIMEALTSQVRYEDPF